VCVDLPSFPTRRSSDLRRSGVEREEGGGCLRLFLRRALAVDELAHERGQLLLRRRGLVAGEPAARDGAVEARARRIGERGDEAEIGRHTSELQSRGQVV